MSQEEMQSASVELAQRLFKEYYASCFWHLKPDLVVTETMIPVIVKGLCAHGGRKGMLAASALQEKEDR